MQCSIGKNSSKAAATIRLMILDVHIVGNVRSLLALVQLEPTDGILLGLDPSFDHVFFTIQQSKFPSSEELGKEEETGRDTQESHEGESNRDGLDIYDSKDTAEENQLEDGVLVDAGLLHILGEDGLGVATGLHEEEKESVPELDARKRGETHEKEDSIEDRKWKKLQHTQEKHGQSQKSMREEHGQSSFLDTQEVAMSILISQSIQMDNAWNCSGNQPWKTHKSIDAVEKTVDAKVIIVGFSMGKLVVLMVDQVPCDAIVKVAEEESHDGRSSSCKWGPTWNIKEGYKPSTCSNRLSKFRAFSGPEGLAVRGAACEGRLE